LSIFHHKKSPQTWWCLRAERESNDFAYGGTSHHNTRPNAICKTFEPSVNDAMSLCHIGKANVYIVILAKTAMSFCQFAH